MPWLHFVMLIVQWNIRDINNIKYTALKFVITFKQYNKNNNLFL